MTGTRFFVSTERPATQDAEGFEALNWTEFGRKEVEVNDFQYSLMHYRIKYILVKEGIEQWLIKNVTNLFTER